MKKISVIVITVLILAVLGLLAYQGLVTKDLEAKNVIRALLILAGLVLTMLKSGRRHRVGNKKTLYEKAYPEYIQSVFSTDKKLEKLFFRAVDDYNQNKPSAGEKKLEALRIECHSTTDLYAVTVFTALCLDDMGLPDKAITEYRNALRIRPHSTLASNMGLCLDRLGQTDEAIDAYEQAIALDKNNATPLNNLGALYFRDGEYEGALEYAEQAISVDPRMPQALSLAAICCALLGQHEAYEDYYRRAVSAGYDGSKIKNTIRSLQTDL